MAGEGRFLVVGDIHGCRDELCVLLDALEPSGEDVLCFLGDYVDRGPDPKGVIDRLLQLRREGPRCRFLRGNHEDMFLSYLGLGGRYGDAFLYNGGGVTLESYGMSGLPCEKARLALPEEHEQFLLGLELMVRKDRFLCVHAGVNPRRPLENQDPEDLLWIRQEFLAARLPFSVVVVFGHTPCRDVEWGLHRKIGLDTGLVYGNKLSCLDLDSGRVWQVRRGENTVHIRDDSARLREQLRNLDTAASSH